MTPVRGMSLDDTMRGLVMTVIIQRLVASGAGPDILNAAATEVQRILHEYEAAIRRPAWRRLLGWLRRIGG